MSNFHQDPWRPGAAVQPAAAPLQEDPPKLPAAENPQEPAEPAGDPQPPAEDEQAVADELERALAKMRGDK